MKKLSKRQIALIGIVLLLVIGIPFGINYCYKCNLNFITTQWEAKDVLTYYGAVLAAGGTAFGVYLSIRASHREYQEDIRSRVLPFIAVTPFDRKARINFMQLLNDTIQGTPDTGCDKEPDGYIEYKLEQIYYIITPQGIEIRNKLTQYQQEVLSKAGAIFRKSPNGAVLEEIDYFSIPVEIENVGNGTAVNLRVGFNRITDNPHRFIRPMMLKQNQTIYIHIFSMASLDVVGGEYVLEFFYKDIYGNKYFQKFPVRFGQNEKGEYQSIDLVGSQTKYEEDIPAALE